MVNSINSEQMKNCCGVYFLHNFFPNPLPTTIQAYGSTEAERKRNYPTFTITQEWVDIQNKNNGNETPEQYKKRIRTDLEGKISGLTNKKSYYLAILNEGESKQIEDIFLEVGFEILVPLTKNPTGSAITLYIYHLLPRPVVKKVVKSVIPRRKI